MTRPPLPAAGTRLRFKSSHRRICLKTSHRRLGDGAFERDEERERYIAPPKRFRR